MDYRPLILKEHTLNMIEIKRIPPEKGELKKFVAFQIDLYKGNEYFVPPLVIDDVNCLLPTENPAFDFCESAYFMAYRDGRPVGRIAAIINRQINEKEHARLCRFGFLDFVDDREVTKALFDAVTDWARSKGMNKLVGPLGFTDMDREGLLIEGFEELSTMATNYNYPYYAEHLEALGFKKDSDWVEFLMKVPDKLPERFDRIATLVSKKYDLHVKKFKSRKEAKREYGHALFHLINEAYKNLYQYSQLTERQIEYYLSLIHI